MIDCAISGFAFGIGFVIGGLLFIVALSALGNFLFKMFFLKK